MLSKTYLESYKMDKFQPLNSGCWHFTLNLHRVWFWGLFSAKDTVKYPVAEHAFEVTTKHWDKLIKDGTAIK